MNKYTLGTIFGAAALGFVKNTRSIGSQIKLTRKKYRFFEYEYFASTDLIDWDGEVDLQVYPDEYWEEMDEIAEKFVNPELIKETFIDELGLSTYLRLGLSMQPYDDGDPNWQFATLWMCFNVEDNSPFLGRTGGTGLILDEIKHRYGDGNIYNIIKTNSTISRVFQKYGISYRFVEYGDGLSGPFDSMNTFNLAFVENNGEAVPYFPSNNNISKLRKR